MITGLTPYMASRQLDRTREQLAAQSPSQYGRCQDEPPRPSLLRRAIRFFKR